MKLLDKFFGKKEHVPIAISLQLCELPDWIESESNKRFSELRPHIKQKYDDISVTLEDLRKSRDILINADFSENVYRRMAKAGTSNRDNLIKNVNNIIEKTVVPGDTDPYNASEFHNNTKSALITCLDNTTRSQEYVKLLFPEGYKGIFTDLKHLDTLLDELIDIINNVRHDLDIFHKLPTEIENISQTHKLIEEKENNIHDLEIKYGLLEKETPIRKKDLEELSRSKEFIKAQEMENQINSLKNHLSEIDSNVRGMFAPLSKALSRMDKQDESGRHILSSDSRNNLKSLIKDPVSVLGTNIIPFFDEMQKLVTDGSLGLKQQKKNKTLEQIKRLAGSDILSSLNEDRESYSTELAGMLKEINELTIYKERTRLEMRISDCLNMVDLTGQRLEQEKKEQAELSEKMVELKAQLRSHLSDISKQDINIIY